MYVGRFLIAAPGVGAYRVSSRSFPNRQVIERDGLLTVVPTDDSPDSNNPYISYNCLRSVERNGEDLAVVGNGSQVDPVAEKLELGYPARDALATGLLALDYEKDDYDTPRIAAVVEPDAATIAIVRKDGLFVQSVDEPHLVATYEKNRPEPVDFDVETGDAQAAADHVYGMDLEHEVCAAGVAWDGDDWQTAIQNGD